MAQEKHYEMQWDCQFCGTKKLLGKTHRFCTNCGAPQNPASRYYPSDEEKIAVEDNIFVGVDVTCPACNQLNSADSEFCQNCGSPLKGGVAAMTLSAQTAGEEGIFESSGSRDVTQEKFDSEMERVGVKKKNEGGGIPKWLPIAAVIAIVACIGIIWFVTRTVETTVNVTGHEWVRTTTIQEYSSFTESSWWNVPVAGDRVVRGICTSRQRDTRQVPDGETCRTVRSDRGDGTFSESQQCTTNYRSEPIYDDWCSYSGFRWEEGRELTLDGGLNDTPDWGNPNLNCANSAQVGCERVSSQVEVYDLLLKGTDGEYRCPLTAEAWKNAKIEQAFTLKVNALNKSIAQCDTLKAAG